MLPIRWRCAFWLWRVRRLDWYSSDETTVFQSLEEHLRALRQSDAGDDAIWSELKRSLRSIHKEASKTRTTRRTSGDAKNLTGILEYSDLDVGWTSLLFDRLWEEILGRNPETFYSPPKSAFDSQFLCKVPLGRGALRVAIVGDAGTGNEFQRATFRAVRTVRPDVVIHLGDVYYGGTEKQTDAFWRGFEGAWTELGETPPPLWAIPGNHEYVTFGKGFRRRLLDRGRLGERNAGRLQRHTFFALVFERLRLQLVGIDTGLHSQFDHLSHRFENSRLHDEEARWLRAQLEFARDRGYRTVLFSHHPAADAISPPSLNRTLLEQIFGDGLENDFRIDGWFWGHDHRSLVLAEDGPFHRTVPRVGHGECVGHGAIPVPVGSYDDVDPNLARIEFFPDVHPSSNALTLGNRIHKNGFATLEIGMDEQPMSLEHFQVEIVQEPSGRFHSFASAHGPEILLSRNDGESFECK